MPEITQQRMGEIIRRVFEFLWFEPDGLPVRDIFNFIRKSSQLTEYEEEYLPNSASMPRYQAILRIATIPLVKAGWLVKTSKGRWYITDAGRRASKQYKDAEDFFEEAIRQYREWKENEDKRLRFINSLEKYDAEEKSWSQIKRFVQGMTKSQFKDLSCDLLQAMGYSLAWVAPPQKEIGQIDMIAFSDPLGINKPRIVVHVHHKGQVVTQEGLVAFVSILAPDNYGILISSSGFTSQVKEDALVQANPYVRLIDLESFVDLWLNYNEKLGIEARQKLPLKPIYFLSMPE
jgi:restriction system protein